MSESKVWDLEDALTRTRVLQKTAYGEDPHLKEGAAYSEFVRLNALGLLSEVGEYLRETNWKPWSVHVGRPTDASSRENRVEELVDAAHFLFNLFALERVTPAELTEAWDHKMKVNADRQRGGY